MDHLVARRTGATNGRNLRTDGTVMESHIRPANDNPLLADEVRVLVRTVMEKTIQEPLENFTRKAKQAACQTEKHPRSSCEAKTQRLAQTLETFLSCAEQVPAAKKIVNLFEEYTDIIRCGKESPPVEYETQDLTPQSGRRADQPLPHQQVSDDSGLFSEEGEQVPQKLGVKQTILPRGDRRSQARLKHESKAWFAQWCHWYAGIEGRMVVSVSSLPTWQFSSEPKPSELFVHSCCEENRKSIFIDSAQNSVSCGLLPAGSAFCTRNEFRTYGLCSIVRIIMIR